MASVEFTEKSLRFIEISFNGWPASFRKMKKNNKIGPSKPKKINDRGVHTKSSALKNKKIGVAICGGIASVESVKIIRELRRYEADVTAFYTPEVKKFITELPVEWASGKKVVTEAQAEVDHLENYDLVVVVPATWNTIAKSALGIADNVVTLLVASHLGKKGKCLFVPAMNLSLQQHPLFETYKSTLESWGAEFLISSVEEERIKVPTPEEVALKVVAVMK